MPVTTYTNELVFPGDSAWERYANEAKQIIELTQQFDHLPLSDEDVPPVRPPSSDEDQSFRARKARKRTQRRRKDQDLKGPRSLGRPAVTISRDERELPIPDLSLTKDDLGAYADSSLPTDRIAVVGKAGQLIRYSQGPPSSETLELTVSHKMTYYTDGRDIPVDSSNDDNDEIIVRREEGHRRTRYRRTGHFEADPNAAAFSQDAINFGAAPPLRKRQSLPELSSRIVDPQVGEKIVRLGSRPGEQTRPQVCISAVCWSPLLTTMLS